MLRYVVVADVYPRHYDDLARMSYIDMTEGQVRYIAAQDVGTETVALGNLAVGTPAEDDTSRRYVIRTRTGLSPNQSFRC